MKIIAPASTIEDLKAYNESQVEGIYLGINNLNQEENIDNKWDSVNERFERKANFNSLEEIKQIYKINKSSKNPAKIYLTLNRAFYTNEQIKRVKQQIITTKDYVDNYIISDPCLIKLVKELAPDNGIVLSCLAVCLNSETVRFYKNLGIKRIILPRHLSLEEIKEIVSKNKDIDFEVMILNQFCRNVDGFCSRCHIPEQEVFTTTCNVPFNQKVIDLTKNNKDKINQVDNNISLLLKKFNPFCGICFIKKLEEIGVNSLKIVGRNNDHKRKINDIKFIKKIISFLELNQQEFEKKCKNLFYEYYNIHCKNNCYY